jgi:hypothetical protein
MKYGGFGMLTSFLAIATYTGPHAKSIANGLSQGTFWGATIEGFFHPTFHLL